jgi:hypothetical protein
MDMKTGNQHIEIPETIKQTNFIPRCFVQDPLKSSSQIEGKIKTFLEKKNVMTSKSALHEMLKELLQYEMR